ncbi:MAG: hypothetical protein ACOCWL_02920, partial [Thermoguttaceae bacterium]
DGCRLKLPTTEFDWTASERLEIDLAPPDSGGFFPALLMWRKLAVEGRDPFDDVYYLGTAPLPGHEELADVTVAQFRGVVAWFYHQPESGKLLAIDLFSDGDDADPCELRFLDYREVEGRQVPGRMEVFFGTDPYAEFRIDSWRFETREP